MSQPAASPAAGHQILPHTADLALEAWAPAKGACIAQAVRALVESFADLSAATPGERVTVKVEAVSDEDLLVRVLDEVIYQLEVHGRLPVEVSVEPRLAAQMGSPAEVRFTTVPAAQAQLMGTVPKAVARHNLRFTRTQGRWRCHVTVDT